MPLTDLGPGRDPILDGLHPGAKPSSTARCAMLTTDAVGGVWRYALELARGLADRGSAPVLAVLGPAPSHAQRREASGLEIVETGLPLDWTADSPAALEDAAAGLIEVCRRAGADIAHLHAPGLVGHSEWPAPVVAVAHSCLATWWRAVKQGALPHDFAWRAEATGLGLRAADAVVAPSRALADALRDAYALTRPVTVIHNGRTRMELPQRQRRRAVLTAGRLWDEGKNAAVLDGAAALLNGPVLAAGPLHGPNGAGIAFRHMRALGPLDEGGLAEQFASCTIFASAALYEPFGLAVLEAAQAGMALVLSDIPSFRELWDGAALFAPPRNVDAFAAALGTALDDPAPLGGRARARATRYSAKLMVDATAALHGSLLRARAASAVAGAA